MENLPLDHNEFALAAEATPNNNNGWIEWDVPLGGDMDEPMIDLRFNEEVMDDDDDGWDEDDEWLMAPVTPPRATVTVSSTYEVGGPSTATPVGHPLATMAPGVATQPQVANSMPLGRSTLAVTYCERGAGPCRTVLHGAELQNQQLRTRVAEIESREGTIMSYMMWMEERLTVLEKRLPQPPSRP
ncbi:hypothetical protein Tco_0273226 [Tanacetum coccineum]